ncbi:MAG: hypothetical protein FJY56_13420 [Betaproteobacteria bacterium]|nr:hypothetical protein [Betaproteobacteria bacterium]
MKPDSRFLSQQWAWRRIKAEIPASQRNQGPAKTPPVVAIIDSGVDGGHEDLRPFLLPAQSVLNGDTRDDDEHGTLLAGTICFATNDVSASAPELKILPIKFCSQQVPPSADRGAQAIRMAVDYPASVIVLSWDCGFDTPNLRQAIEYAGKRGATVVVAAGNHAMNNDLYPNWPANYGNLDHVITVMASDRHDERASFSSYGNTTVYIAAPGVDILSTVPYYGRPAAGNTIPLGYRFHRGSSAATAYVAGLVALLRARNPSWTPKDVKQRLGASVTPLASLKGLCVTGGIINHQLAFSRVSAV